MRLSVVISGAVGPRELSGNRTWRPALAHVDSDDWLAGSLLLRVAHNHLTRRLWGVNGNFNTIWISLGTVSAYTNCRS